MYYKWKAKNENELNCNYQKTQRSKISKFNGYLTLQNILYTSKTYMLLLISWHIGVNMYYKWKAKHEKELNCKYQKLNGQNFQNSTVIWRYKIYYILQKHTSCYY